MKAFAQFMLSIGSMGSLDTGMLTQILLLGNNDADEDFESETPEVAQKLKLRLYQKSQEINQHFEVEAGTWAVAAELEKEDGSFIYQLVRF